MPTIIDSLVVTLGLDPKGMVAGAKASQKALKSVSDEAAKSAKEMEARGEQASQFFKKIRNEALTMLAVFTAGMGLKQFTQNTINSAAALGQMSQNLGMSTQRLNAWQRAAERAGGSAEGIVSTLKESANEVAKFKMGQASDSTQWFFRLGGDPAALKDGNSYLLARAKIISDIYKTDPARAALVASQMGISDDQFNLIKQGPAAILKLVDAQEKNSAITAKNAEDAQKLRNKWLDLRDTLTYTGQTVLIALIPTFEKLVEKAQVFAQWVQDHKEDIVIWVDSAVKAITELVVMLDKGAEAVGGWKNVLIALLALKVLSFTASLLSMAAALVRIGGALGVIGGVGGAALKVLGPLALLFHSGDLNAGEEQELAARRAQAGSAGGSSASGAAPTAGTADGVIDSLVKKGWTKEQAAGIAANLWAESKFDPKATGDGGKAYGVGQWHPDRQNDFKNLFKKDIRDSTLEEQLMFLTYEMNQGKEQKAGDKLRKAKTAEEAAAIVSKDYERPADREGEAAKRAAAAKQIDSAYGARNAAATGSMPAGASTTAPQKAVGGGNTSSSETHIGQVNINTKATDANGIARDFNKEMQRYSTGSQANTGLA